MNRRYGTRLSVAGKKDVCADDVVRVMSPILRYCHDCVWGIRDANPEVNKPTQRMIEHAVATGHDVERLSVEWR